MTKLDARREQMLTEMGIKPRWQLRAAAAAVAEAPETAAPVQQIPSPAPVMLGLIRYSSNYWQASP